MKRNGSSRTATRRRAELATSNAPDRIAPEEATLTGMSPVKKIWNAWSIPEYSPPRSIELRQRQLSHDNDGLTTDFSGSIKKVQISAPLSNIPAVTRKGAIQEPRCAKNPKITGDTEAAKAPAMFITPVTVPLYSPPTSMGTAQAGPNTISRKNSEAVKQRTAVEAEWVVAAGMRHAAEASMHGAATTRRASLSFPVLLYTPSVNDPPAMSPTIPASSGRDATMPRDFKERWRYSSR